MRKPKLVDLKLVISSSHIDHVASLISNALTCTEAKLLPCKKDTPIVDPVEVEKFIEKKLKGVASGKTKESMSSYSRRV